MIETAPSTVAARDEEPQSLFARVLIALQDPRELEQTAAVLRARGDDVTTVAHPQSLLEEIRRVDAELIILDSRPGTPNAYQLCERLRAHSSTRSLAILLVVDRGDEPALERGVEVGADDFLMRPLVMAELKARATSLVRSRRLHDQMKASESLIFNLARLLDEKMPSQSDDVARLSRLVDGLGRAAGVDETDLRVLRKSAMLHDIGKLAVRDAVLLKHEVLSAEEFNEIKLHPEVGELLCGPLADADELLPVIRYQRERWDGKGYPDHLQGEQIPLLARIFAIADSYAAMTRNRPHRSALSPEAARAALGAGAGRQWDPDLVQLFCTEVLPGIEAEADQDPSEQRRI